MLSFSSGVRRFAEWTCSFLWRYRCLCFVSSSELRFFLKTKISATTLLLYCSLQTLSVQCVFCLAQPSAVVELLWGNKGPSPEPALPSMPPLCLACARPLWERALSCVVLQPLLKFQGCVTCNTMFLLSKDFLAPPHAGFVKLYSW